MVVAAGGNVEAHGCAVLRSGGIGVVDRTYGAAVGTTSVGVVAA